jgi:hypothetical protein
MRALLLSEDLNRKAFQRAMPLALASSGLVDAALIGSRHVATHSHAIIVVGCLRNNAHTNIIELHPSVLLIERIPRAF